MTAQPDTPPRPEDPMTSWALGILAMRSDDPLPAPPRHPRIEHLSDALSLGTVGTVMVSLLYGLWRAPGPHPAITAAMLNRATDQAGPQTRGQLVFWGLAAETTAATGAPLALVLDETIGDWIVGGDPIPPAWQDRIMSIAPCAPLACWRIEDLAAQCEATLADHAAPAPLVVSVTGEPGTGRRTFAATLSDKIGTRPIFADLGGLDVDGTRSLVRIVERAALLSLHPPAYFNGSGVAIPQGHPAFAFRFDIAQPGAVALRHTEGQRKSVSLRVLNRADRQLVWSTLSPAFAGWTAEDQASVVNLKASTVGEIAQAAATPRTPQDAIAALKHGQRHRLNDTFAVHRGQLDWDDLILPQPLMDSLHRLSAEIALTPKLWEDVEFDRLYPQGRGVFALFSGKSGTGKTMAAQVMARALGIDLYVVDAGSVVSKYVGETAQNLQAILRQAEDDAALLFFDEADGLFGKRTDTRDAHARYLNSDTNVLLQAVEQYGGACILATNRRDNIDPAFTRRLRYALDFPRPDSGLRQQMWRYLSAKLSPASAQQMTDTCAILGATFEFSGGQIKNALRTAVVEARRDGRSTLCANDLILGAHHEIQKEGRALTPAEHARLVAP